MKSSSQEVPNLAKKSAHLLASLKICLIQVWGILEIMCLQSSIMEDIKVLEWACELKPSTMVLESSLISTT